MKKITLSLLLVALCSIVYAQKGPVTYGIKAGLTLPHLTVSAFGTAVSLPSKTSFYVGGVADIPVSKMVSVQPGLSLVNKGTKVKNGDFEFEEGTLSEEGTINFAYLEIPVNLMLKLKTGKSGQAFVGAGPYYAFAIDANAKAGGAKEDIEIGSADGLKRGEFGFNFLGGYQLDNGLNLHLGYGIGISNVFPSAEELDVKLKNRVFSVGLGFMF